jgi:hypothetical protein
MQISSISIRLRARTDANGYFEIDVQPTDTLHISLLGFQSLRVKVTNDWIKNKVAKIFLTERAIALEEIVIRPFNNRLPK